MLSNAQEYDNMAEAEKSLWWYKALHNLVLEAIQESFDSKEISLLDAGCGSGGLLLTLKAHGFHNLRGFDISKHALGHCQQRRLDVVQEDLLNISNRYPATSVDVIVSNDTLCCLTADQRKSFLVHCHTVLKPHGLLILNLPALAHFQGLHDKYVGIKHRFSKTEVPDLFKRDLYEIVQQTYWPFLLAPLIYLVRLSQRVKLLLNPATVPRSDVRPLAAPLNKVLEKLTQYESSLLWQKPFGSSLFLVARKVSAQS